jgi:hypothetical protein
VGSNPTLSANLLVMTIIREHRQSLPAKKPAIWDAIGCVTVRQGFRIPRPICRRDRNFKLRFPYVAQVCRIDERPAANLKSGPQPSEIVLSVTRLPPEQASPQRLLELNRGQWRKANHSHCLCDVTFDGDRSRIVVGRGLAVMAALRNFAIALTRLHGFTNLASALRAFAYQPRRTPAAVGVEPSDATRATRPFPEHAPRDPNREIALPYPAN